jgi:F-type H+-transporting ATPase subunit alpha
MSTTIRDFSHYFNKAVEIGFVHTNNHPIIYVKGLPTASLNETVLFEDNSLGVITGVSENLLQIASFSKRPHQVASKVVRTGEHVSVPVGSHLLGASVDSFNNSIHNDTLISEDTVNVVLDVSPRELSQRRKITLPYYTGVAVVDILLPLGKGQRELLIGDNQTGKSSFLLQLCSFQIKTGGIVIYCCIGKSKSDIKQIESYFNTYKLKDKVILYISESTDPLISIINTPFTAMSTAEWFCAQGYDVTVILDDLGTHAKYYREFSLLGNKFPGRSSYPGDIFYLHARLLERAGNFAINNEKKSEASITCFPVVNTVENDVSGYIQTNIMSITDGHLFFDREVFTKGRRPPINYFLSVTRVGRQTQNSLRWAVNRELLSFLSLYEKVQNFVQFGAELNEGTRSTLLMGDRIEAVFNQDIEDTMPISLQIMIIALIWLGTWNTEDIASIKINTKKMMNLYVNDTSYAGLVDSLVYNATSMNQLLFSVNQNLASITKYV